MRAASAVAPPFEDDFSVEGETIALRISHR